MCRIYRVGDRSCTANGVGDCVSCFALGPSCSLPQIADHYRYTGVALSPVWLELACSMEATLYDVVRAVLDAWKWADSHMYKVVIPGGTCMLGATPTHHAHVAPGPLKRTVATHLPPRTVWPARVVLGPRE